MSADELRTMLTMRELKERGWTEVRDLLGAPDRRAPNPHYRSAAPMRLWAPDRITAIEAGEDFAARLEACAIGRCGNADRRRFMRYGALARKTGLAAKCYGRGGVRSGRRRPNADLMIKSSSCAACRRLVASGDRTSLKAVSASRTFIGRARITVTGTDIGATGGAAPCDRHSGEQ